MDKDELANKVNDFIANGGNVEKIPYGMKSKNPKRKRKIVKKARKRVKKSFDYSSLEPPILRYNEKYMRSKEWTVIRYEIFQMRDGKCEVCGKNLVKKYCVHHLTYKNYMMEEPEDLLLCCNPCHMKIHGKYKRNFSRKKRR